MPHHYVADLHIHIGRTASGKPVKITGAKSLTLRNIFEYAGAIKGIDLIGIIDCHVPEIMEEIEALVLSGEAEALEEGGIRYQQVTLLLGCELEIYDEHCQGPIHVLIYFPHLKEMKQFSEWLAQRMKNVTLSSQRIYETARTIQDVVKQLEGLFIFAHAFTPYKSVYGKGVQSSLTEVFDPDKIDAVELGLSSDTSMADQITELHRYPYLTNSDAHSLEKMAREYQIVELCEPSFYEFEKALHGQDGRAIIANYGLNPYLGKYYFTSCEKCMQTREGEQASCAHCGHTKVVKGVYNRLAELADADGNMTPKRPPYVHQVPLEFIPKLGPKTLAKLRDYFQTDMAIIHDVPEEALKEVTSPAIVVQIMKARSGTLEFHRGGAGRYGKVKE